MSGGYSTELWLSRADELRPQHELQHRVWEELGWEAFLDPGGLTIDVAACLVKITGSVASHPERLAAVRAARRVPGVQEVQADILVTLPHEHRRTDPQLAHAVAQLLEWDRRVPRGRIEGRVANGVVTLTGLVERACERAAAEDVVAHLIGLQDVVNQIEVEQAPPAGDLKPMVEASLRRRVDLHGDRIKVTTHGAEVVLHGHVRSLAERDEAEEAALAVPGVGRVRVDLRVGR